MPWPICLIINGDWHSILLQSNSLGIILGLIVGKPFGIFIFTFLGVLLGLCELPKDLNWKNILGSGFLGGIGFTMSIFITLLAFSDSELIVSSKIAIVIASTIAAVIGYFSLKLTLKLKK